MTTPGFVYTHDAATIHFFNTRMRILVSGGQTAGAFCMIEVRSPAGNHTPLHVHRRETETIHVLQGGLTAVIDGRRVQAGPGDTVVLPPDIPHQLISGSQDTRTLLFCTPAGFDDFVQAAGTDTPIIPDPATRARAVAIAAQFGVEILTG